MNLLLTILATDPLPAPDSFPAIGWVVAVLIVIVVGLNQIVQLVQSFRPKPSYEEKFATREDISRIDKWQDKHEKEHTEMWTFLNQREAKASEGRAKLHAHIDSLGAQLNGRIDGTLTKLAEKVAEASYTAGVQDGINQSRRVGS